MTVHIAGHEGIGRVIGRKFASLVAIHINRFFHFFLTNLLSTVGRGVSNAVLHRRVGVKYVDSIVQCLSVECVLTETNRWLYNYCGECDICAKNVAYCPNQQNPGRVSCTPSDTDRCYVAYDRTLTGKQNVNGSFQRM